MDIKHLNGTRYIKYDEWGVKKNIPYNYRKNGIVDKILSHKIVESNNEVLNLILNYYENSIIFLLNYVDILKHFKDPHWKNR